jgi:hypothetical protein
MPFDYAFDAPTSAHTVVIENDDRTVWAYLHGEDGVLSDVWLFNVVDAPEELEPERDRPPANPARFCSPEARVVIEYPDDVEVRWDYADGVLRSVEVFARTERLARLAPGMSPAWSRFAAVDGPCALRLD